MQRRMTGLTAGAAALVLTATLAGCGSSGASNEVTLRLVAADYGDSAANSSRAYWDKVVKGFEAENPDIDVQVDVESWKDVDRKVADLVAAGKEPDLAQIGAYADYADADKLYPVDDLLSIGTQADFLPGLADAGEIDRVQYGMPFGASTRLLFYNKDLFEDAGITPPQSWDELRSDAAALKADGVKYPFALPLGAEEAQAETMMWMLGGGDGYTDDIGSYTIDSDMNVDTFDWLKTELVDKGLTGPVDPGKLDRAEAFAAFSRGEVGMLNGHPTLMQMAAKKGVDFGVVPMPGRKGEATATLGVADWMMAFKKSGHREEIGTFLDYAYSEKNVLDFSVRYDLLPVTHTASTALNGDDKHQNLQKFLKELPTARLYPVGKTSWAKVSAGVKKEIGGAVKEGGSPASVLGHLQRSAKTAENAE